MSEWLNFPAPTYVAPADQPKSVRAQLAILAGQLRESDERPDHVRDAIIAEVLDFVARNF